MAKEKRILAVLWVLLIGITLLGIYKSRTKLTYIERTTINDTPDKYIKLNEDAEEISQEFYSPYDIVQGIAVKIGTFVRENNSTWLILLYDENTEKPLYEKRYNASFIKDNQFYLFKFDKNLRLDRNKQYKFVIRAEKVSENTALAFYYSNESKVDDADFYVNDTLMEGDICFAVYGGDYDKWWLGYVFCISLYFAVLLVRANQAINKGCPLWKDKLFCAVLLTGIVFLLLSSFSVGAAFTDENDNIRGGMIVANGGVIYRDYVTQHTPFVYYLCSFFAVLGAGSVQQFRLFYYAFEAIIWALLFYRHADFWGWKKMFLLPAVEVVFISSIISPQGFQILSDGVFGICIVALLLEFMQYYKDKKLGWGRAIIVSCCIWCSFGASFISVYALVWVVLAVLGIEIADIRKREFAIKDITKRYYKLLISIIVPFSCSILYFKLTNSLGCAYEQSYLFNREIYSNYQSGLGSDIVQPIINSIQNFFCLISKNFILLINADASGESILRLIIAVGALAIIITLAVEKKYVQAVLLFLVMCCSAVRGYGFHGLAAWYMAIMIIVVFSDKIENIIPRIGLQFLGVTAVFLLSIYINTVGDNLLSEQESVSILESEVIAATDSGEEILIDAYYCDSIYLLYKDRYPMNRAVYMLPWYMDWYEQETIDDLNEKAPRIAVFNEDQRTWEYTHYANAFAIELRKNYTRVSDEDEGWASCMWIRNSGD